MKIFKNKILTSTFLTILMLALVFVIAQAVAGSNFEIEDGNIKVDGASPSLDWANVNEIRNDDLPSGQDDDSFGNGTKEDTEPPSPVTGSIPPNKSDLKTFGVYKEENADGKFLHLFWTRVQDPSGTTNMDFEFNQSTTLSANGVTPVRTAGDLLIVYELSKGGTVPNLFLLKWLDGVAPYDGTCDASNSYPCWGDRQNLTAAGAADGSINEVTIPAADSDGLGDLDARTFGEATVNLDLVFDPEICTSLGSAYLKSRSSDSFTAALKDFIAPIPVSISNCGQVIVRKVTVPASTDLFGFTPSLTTEPANGSPFNLANGESHTISNVLSGTNLSIAEDSLAGTGFVLTDIDCSASSNGVPIVTDIQAGTATFDLEVGQTVDCTFTNSKLPLLKLVKEIDPTDDGGKFDLKDGDVVKVDDGGHEATSGFYITSVGPHIISEVAGTDTSLIYYDSMVLCDNDKGSANPGTSLEINLNYGDEVTCTFKNTLKRGTIKVVKETVPAGGGGQLFGFTGDAAGSIGDGGMITVPGLLPGQYTSTETVPDGWDLTGISCNDVNSTVDLGTKTATFNLEADETVTCTFTNTKRGTIIVDKVTDPAGDPQSFDFDADWLGDNVDDIDFSLTDVAEPFDSGYLEPGTYAVSENSIAGWDLDSATCDDGSDPGSIDLAPGETVTCTFTNTKRGRIDIVKETNPDGSTQLFDFNASWLDDINDPQLSDGQIWHSATLVPGEYSVSEDPITGWALDSAICDDGSDPGSIDLAPGELVTCTFTNSTGAILISKTTKNYTLGVSPLAGVTFEIRDGDNNLVATVTTDADGEACVGGLIVGDSYSITETDAPDGYDPTLVLPQDVIAAAAECGGAGTPAPADFVNDPLSEIEIIFRSLAGGGVTASSIVCEFDSAAIVAELEDGNPDPALDDLDEVFTDLIPGTYTCTIVIDP